MENKGGIDECLLPYLHSIDERTSQQYLAHLLSQIARPVIEQILERALSQDRKNEAQGIVAPDAQDVTGDVLVKVLRRLRTFKTDPTGKGIHNFRGLVATTTYRILTDNQRENHRRRHNEERKLRRLFAANPNLAIWQDAQGDSFCGYAVWRDENAKDYQSDEESKIPYDPISMVEELRIDVREGHTAEVVLLILDRIGQPVPLNYLLKITMARTIENKTISLDAVSFAAEEIPELMIVQDPEAALETRLLLERLFQEMQRLSLLQRKSLLLNMVDSYGFGVEWFTFTEIASEAQLAALLALSLEEFRELLDSLPITDKEIGERLGIDSVKVANIRKAVRDRLGRRRRTFLHESKKAKLRR